MAAQTVTLLGRKYVLIPEAEYRKLNRTKATPRPKTRTKATRKQIEDPDVIEAIRRLNDPNETETDLETVKRQLGFR